MLEVIKLTEEELTRVLHITTAHRWEVLQIIDAINAVLDSSELRQIYKESIED